MMQEKWNQFVYDLAEAKRHNVDEQTYHTTIEYKFELLGWVRYKGDIGHKERFAIGSNSSLEPDILIKKDGEVQFVVEVKRPVHSQTERECEQLKSYMRYFKLLVGVYIGEHVEIFYDKPGGESIVSVLKIDLNLDEKKGTKFVELFSKENFSKDVIREFCEERLQEIHKRESLSKIKEHLMSDEGTSEIAESVRRYLTEKYADAYSEKDIEELLASFTFKAVPLFEQPMTTIPVSPVISNPPFTEIRRYQPQWEGKEKDTTKYSLNGGYGLNKRKFVLAVVKEYVRLHPEITYAELEQVFPPKIQGSSGVIRKLENISVKQRMRYFMKGNEILHTGKDNIRFAVCNQWGIFNVVNIVARARELGFKVEERK